jgi:hypothetical protein
MCAAFRPERHCLNHHRNSLPRPTEIPAALGQKRDEIAPLVAPQHHRLADDQRPIRETPR